MPQVTADWTLQFNSNGSALSLIGQSGKEAVELLTADIAWQAGDWHLVTLNYGTGPKGTALFIDGQLAAEGAGTLAVSPPAAAVVIASTFPGTDAIGGEIDEIYCFGLPLTAEDVAFYWNAYRNQAALGPITAAEDQAEAEAAAKWQAEHESEGGGSPMMRLVGPTSECFTNVPVYITNMVAMFDTNQGWTVVTFDIQGSYDGTTTALYDVFTATNLIGPWSWLERGQNCSTYQYTNGGEQAFYILGTPLDTDDDLIPDAWEVNNGLDPNNASDANDDPDGDGFTNYQEYLAGSNPQSGKMVVAWGDNSSGQSTVPYGLNDVVAVVGGLFHSLVLKNNGTVVTWGGNSKGETNVPANLTNVIAIAANWQQSVALKSNGTVVQWGETNASVPASLTNAVAISAGNSYPGNSHSLALRATGLVVSWGDATDSFNSVPTNLTGVKAIAAGWNHNSVLLSNGTVVAWGASSFGATNVPSGLSNVTAIAVGAYHTLALKSDGTVVAWGAGQSNGSPLFNFGQSIVPDGLSNIVAIAAGGYHSTALRSDGTAVMWGDLGLPGFPLNGIVGIGAGVQHALAIRSGLLTPLIATQPQDQAAPAGSNVTFSVTVLSPFAPHYQWQFNSNNIANATNATLTLNNVSTNNEGSYHVIVSNGAGSVTSSDATFTLVRTPQIVSTTPSVPSTNWITTNTTLSVVATAAATNLYPIQYQWKRNGVVNTNITGSQWTLLTSTAASALDGDYTVAVTNAAGSTNVGTWRVRAFYPGMVAAWGANGDGELNRPADLTNTLALAAGEFHSVAVKETGAVVQWGYNWGNVPTNLTNAIAVSAGYSHTLALRSVGTVIAWGENDAGQTNVPLNLAGVKAIASGWYHNVALKTNGEVVVWGYNLFGQTNAPPNLTNVTAIAAGAQHSLALRSDGNVVAWGFNDIGQTNVPTGLSNVVGIAAGGAHSLALKSDGKVEAWGLNTSGQCSVPTGLSNVMAVAAGWAHSVAFKNDGTVVAWGDNSSGQTNPGNGLVEVKMIAAGGDHTLASRFSPVVQYSVDVSKDLLLIYNTNSLASSNVWSYYMQHRPMVSGANVLPIGCTTNETFLPDEYTNVFAAQVQTWLTNNPTKRPQYVILFLDVPSRVNTNNTPGVYDQAPAARRASVSVQLRDSFPGIKPFVTHINFKGTNDCRAYIDKLEYFGTNYAPGKLIINASSGGYTNSYYYFDDAQRTNDYHLGQLARDGVLAAGVSSNFITYAAPGDQHILTGTNVAGFFTWGYNAFMGSAWVTNGVKFFGQSSWYIIETGESYNGVRTNYLTSQPIFLEWFSSIAFGGTNYSNTPVGGVSQVDEPNEVGLTASGIYFGLWAQGKPFGICAWNSRQTIFYQTVGDPFVRR